MITLGAAAVLTTVTVAIASGIAAGESLVSRHVMQDGQLLSWPVARNATKWRTAGAWSALLDAVMSGPRYVWVTVARLTASVVVLAAALTGELLGWGIAVLAVTAVAVSVRSPFGLDGAHQMTLLIAVSMAMGVGVEALGGEGAMTIVMWFIALQLFLSYAIAGIAKLVSPVWRNGQALPGLLSTQMYGHRRLADLLARHRWRAVVGCWGVMLMEVTLPLALIMPTPVALGLLACGAFFHIGTAVVMGLNNFLLAFIAAYPAAVFVITA